MVSKLDQVKNCVLDLLSQIDEDKLTYHNKQHTFDDVYKSAEELCKREGITGKKKELVLIAALGHDTGFVQQYSKNEPIGADITAELMSKLGYSSQEIEKVRGMILATALPQNPKNKLEAILCDADLGVFGQENFFERNDDLRQELGAEDKIKWYEQQIEFLKGHNYFTDSARELFGSYKEKHVKELQARLAKLKNG